jgi:hypothetical protein
MPWYYEFMAIVYFHINLHQLKKWTFFFLVRSDVSSLKFLLVKKSLNMQILMSLNYPYKFKIIAMKYFFNKFLWLNLENIIK